MNYYERHIGDYLKDTAHLSLLEHGVYSRLLDVYYTRESGIPDNQAARLIGARTEPETQALQVVLQEFFELRDGAWRQGRCDQEISRYTASEPEREVKKANEDNRLKRHRHERAELFKVLVSAGKHAPWNIGMTELRALVSALQVTGTDTPPATAPATATATPATATQEPVAIPSSHISPSLRSGDSTPKRATRAKRSEITLQAYLDLCKAEGKKPIPPDHSIRDYCRDAGITDEMVQVSWVVFRDKYLTGEHAKKGYKDWPDHFANNVKNRWQNLWFVNTEGSAEWTATGQQARRVAETRAKPKQEPTHEPA